MSLEQAKMEQEERKIELSLYVSECRFKMFFIGLIFATLSFLLTHSLNSHLFFIKLCEILGLYSLFFSGLIMLAQLSNGRVIHVKEENKLSVKLIECIKKHFLTKKLMYWIFYLIGMQLILLDRMLQLFINNK